MGTAVLLNSVTDLFLEADDTISSAIRTLDKNSVKLVMVVDDKYQLLGTVTDGDIRRALLNHCSLEHPIKDVMNKNPKVINDQESELKAKQMMKLYDIPAVPKVSGGRIVGLVGHQKIKKYDNPVFFNHRSHATNDRGAMSIGNRLRWAPS
ncbi:MAG: CBS domain-containing protein, partial [Cytophagales bacterium]|nr:CBS domain-containing protein [Cytophagales bacterium]